MDRLDLLEAQVVELAKKLEELSINVELLYAIIGIEEEGLEEEPPSGN